MKNKAFLSFKKLKNWKILPVTGSLFLIFAKECLKFTLFLQNYQVFKCKWANLCSKNVENLEILRVRICHHFHQLPPTHAYRADERTLKIHLASPPYAATFFASDRCVLIILSESFWKNVLKIIWNIKNFQQSFL